MNDLKEGLVVTSPANNNDIDMRHRHLKGPYVASNAINSVFSDRINIRYADLFSYKFWRNGQLIQNEEPQNDISELLNFEIGTTHKVETIRTNPIMQGRQWVENYTISIQKAEDIVLSGCSYSTVKLTYSGSEKGTKLYIPELLLDVTPNQWGEYHTIRKRNLLDGQKWPFNKSPIDALDYADVIPTD